jgi:hypothetical protein
VSLFEQAKNPKKRNAPCPDTHLFTLDLEDVGEGFSAAERKIIPASLKIRLAALKITTAPLKITLTSLKIGKPCL